MTEPPAGGPGAKVLSFVPVKARTNAAVSRPQQLALGLDQPHELLIVVTDQLHGATFLRWLLQVRPKVIVDVRFAPHFNFTAIDANTVK